MPKFNREVAEKVAEINKGKVSPNMDYVSFPGYWSANQIENFKSRYDNVLISNGRGTWTDQEHPMSNGDYYLTSIVMISWD